MKTSEVATHLAKKPHRCTWCWQLIEVSTKYNRFRNYDGDEVGTEKLHLECYTAMLEAAKEEGGYIEWIPGMERPEVKNVPK